MLIDERSRLGSCGEWHDATSPDGTAVGALRIDAELLRPPQALSRLVAWVTRLRADHLGGSVPIADLIQRPTESGQDIWLITAGPVSPTLADLDPANGEADSVGILLNVGQALLELHAAGLAHGALSPSSVVIDPSAGVRLVDVGTLAALTGAEVGPSDDARQWADLVRGLAGSGTGAQAARLARSADVAEQTSLAAGVAALSTAESPTAELSIADPPPMPPGRTMLGRRGGAAVAAPAPAAEAGQLIRFGPGVPAAETAAAAQASRTIARRTRSRRRRNWAGALLTLVVVVGVIVWWWWRLGGLEVEGATVHASPVVAGCDTTVDVVGVIATNGRRGVIHYVWRRNDGNVTGPLAQNVSSGQHSATVHLAWSFAGHGTFDAVASLEIVSPESSSAKGRFIYRC